MKPTVAAGITLIWLGLFVVTGEVRKFTAGGPAFLIQKRSRRRFRHTAPCPVFPRYAAGLTVDRIRPAPKHLHFNCHGPSGCPQAPVRRFSSRRGDRTDAREPASGPV